MNEFLTAAIAWRDEDPDPVTRATLDQLIVQAQADNLAVSKAALNELSRIFAGPLHFGTAGLRGQLGPGPAQMNRVVVSQAAAGLAAWLSSVGDSGGKVIVGYDARFNSEVFAHDTARIMTAAGFQVLVAAQPTPTPVIAFGIKHFGCVAGVVVTASHNPPNDNGYKVYLGDGSQIIPPVDEQIAAEITKVAAKPLSEIPRKDGWTVITESLLTAYVSRAASLVPASAPRNISWVYTPLHGVGGQVVGEVVKAAGFPQGRPVMEQMNPDPSFPTVAFPNPEEPGAIDLALALAKDSHADLVIANDPDADRCAVAVPFAGRWRMLTGDELGVLLGDDAFRRGAQGTYACSIVSSTLLKTMATKLGYRFETTLTGFKWIGRVPDLAFGYEEAIGYCCDPEKVKDKDGITALLFVLRIAAELKESGQTIADRLDEIARTWGVYATTQLSVRVSDLSFITKTMAHLRANPPSQLAGESVVVHDLQLATNSLPPTDGVEFTGAQVHVVVRPSGTEPKLKCYLEARVSAEHSSIDLSGAKTKAKLRLDTIQQEMKAVLGLS